MSSTTPEKRIVTLRLPTVDQYEERFIGPLFDALDDLDEFVMHVESVTGLIPTDHWQAQLEHAPTVADLGAYAIFVDDLQAKASTLRRYHDQLSAAFGRLEAIRLESGREGALVAGGASDA